VDYAGLNIVEGLPDYFHGPSGQESIFRRLPGAKILRIGSTNERGIEGGGLILDYELNGKSHRLVFAFTELGMWVEYDSFAGVPLGMNLNDHAS
jgi:hypothetical protein